MKRVGKNFLGQTRVLKGRGFWFLRPPAAPRGGGKRASPPATPPAPPLSLKTAAFNDGGDIPAKYGCDVAQGAPMVSPALQWTNTPKGAVSLVLIMHDTDANPQKGILD